MKRGHERVHSECGTNNAYLEMFWNSTSLLCFRTKLQCLVYNTKLPCHVGLYGYFAVSMSVKDILPRCCYLELHMVCMFLETITKLPVVSTKLQ